MSLALHRENLDGLDAAFHALYKQGTDGKFHLEVEGMEDTSALKSALQKERDNAKKSADLVKSWQALGKTPEEISELLKAQDDLQKKQEELERSEALKKGEYQKVLDGEAKKREQMAAKHQAEVEALRTEAGRYRGLLETNLIESQAVAAIAAAKGVPELLLPHLRGRVKVLEQDGKFNLQILDAAGNPMVADASGTPATFKHLVDSFKADPIFGRAFEGSGASGPGGSGNPGGGAAPGQKTMPRKAYEQLPPSEQLAFVKGGGKPTD